MLSTLWFLAFITVIWALAYCRIARWIWTPTVFFCLWCLTFYSTLSGAFLLLSWVIFLTLAVVINIPPLRLRCLTQPLYAFVRRTLPPMSRTEKEAIEAGQVWWEADLFCGNPDWKKYLSFPKAQLTEEEQSFLDNEVETVCSMVDDWKMIQEEGDLFPEVWTYLKKSGFFGLIIPKEYGGKGFSALAHSAVIVKLCTRSVSVAVSSMVPNSLGPGELILHYGTTSQKQYYLPRLARGEEMPCFVLTGVEAGSDAAAISDHGIVCKDQHEGKEVIGVRINWNKRYITLAPHATVMSIAFKLFDPEHLLGKEHERGITMALIPTNHPGVEIGKRHCPLNLAFMNGPTRGKDVFIPLEWIIGGPEMIGLGWRMLMESLSVGRAISLPALSTATGQLCYKTSSAYARVRTQFDVPIGKFEGIQETLARMGGTVYLLEATRCLSTSAVDQHVKPAVVSAISKYHMTELLRKMINDAMDVHGGRGIQLGPRNYIGHGYISAPLAITVEGANILTRNLIIFGQGAIRCHPYLRYEMDAAEEADQKRGLAKFDTLLLSHIGYSISNFARALFMGLSAARFISVPVQGETARYYRSLTRMSVALALVSDVAMLFLGGDLKRRERLSARLGDVLSYLYLGVAALKYYEDHSNFSGLIVYVHWSLQTVLYRTQEALEGFFENFPLKNMGRFLRWIIFPLGRSYRLPQDKLDQAVATHMQTPSEDRDLLSALCYVGNSPQDPVKRVERAFHLMVMNEATMKKLHTAVRAGVISKDLAYEDQLQAALKSKVITIDEAKLLRETHAAYMDAIEVDEFDKDYFKRTHVHDKAKTH